MASVTTLAREIAVDAFEQAAIKPDENVFQLALGRSGTVRGTVRRLMNEVFGFGFRACGLFRILCDGHCFRPLQMGIES